MRSSMIELWPSAMHGAGVGHLWSCCSRVGECTWQLQNYGETVVEGDALLYNQIDARVSRT